MHLGAEYSRLKSEEVKAVARSLKELSESYVDAARALKSTATTAQATTQLWRSEKRPALVKAGLTLIALPEPGISMVVGSALVAVGAVQEGIRKRTVYVDDICRVFRQTLKELRSIEE